MTERVVVIGAGMAGLWTALALAPTGRRLVLLDRDPAPPEGGVQAAFDDWRRRGVGQLRHSHAFLARLRLLIRDTYPDLLADLLAAGCRELPFENALTALHRRRYAPKPVDRDLVILTSRRTTLEWVMRRHVERLPGVTIRAGVFACGLEIEPGEPMRVVGVRLADGELVAGDLVVDAGGRAAPALSAAEALGAPIAREAAPAGIVYFTRHYRLLEGATEPARGRGSTTADLGYLKFGVFPADGGWFSVTLCLPEVETEMRKSIVAPDTFDAVCRQLPGVAPWVAADRARGVSRVFGMGGLDSAWADLAPRGRPAVLGLFGVGDSAARTNPLYGRGCAFAAVAAHVLRDALEATRDPGARLLRYRAGMRRELRPYYDVMTAADRAADRRARQLLTHSARPSLRRRLLRSFLRDGVQIAVRSDPDLLRAFLRGFHMLEHPQAWLRRPGNLAKVLRVWARGRRRNAEAYPVAGPERAALLSAVGVSPGRDVERLTSARA